MANGDDNIGEKFASKELEESLKEIFKDLPNQVSIILFTHPDENDVLNDAARDIVEYFQGLSDKISIEEHDLESELAQRWSIMVSPTIIISPDDYKIRWVGAPGGEETKAFLQALVMAGSGISGLSDQSKKVLKQMDSPRDVKIFVSVTCPYCPQQIVNIVKAAIERPDLISVEVIDTMANRDLAIEYGVKGVPQTFANDEPIATGAQTEELFMLSLQKLEQQTHFIPDVDSEVIEKDLVIVGGGPAGLTAGIYAVRSGLNACIIERGALGGQITLTPVVENYTGFTMVGGKALVDVMVNHALQYTQMFQG